MGAGKSTVARRLGDLLNWPVLDLDDAMEQRCGTPIHQIFSEHGEDHFRQLEAQELATCLRSPAPCVVAVGGGAIEMETNRRLLQSATHARTFYLEAPLAELLARCATQSHSRPLLLDAERLFQRRAGLYPAVGATVSTFGFSAEQVAAHILSLLQMDNALSV
jgi:shikimate kinase